MARVSRRTFANVYVSAMRARHPDVPNLIGSSPALRGRPAAGDLSGVVIGRL